MVDVETTGHSKDHAAVIQIAAVRFDLETGEIDTNFFDQALALPPNRFWEEDTKRWWSRMPEVFESIWVRQRPPELVIPAFAKWVNSFGVSDPVFWAKPISFDWPFLESYFRQFEVANPFHFRSAENVNTFVRARYRPRPPIMWDKELAFEGDEHNALHDCIHQIRALHAAYEDTK